MGEAHPLKHALSGLTLLCAIGACATARADGSVSALGMGRGTGPNQPMGAFEAVVQQYNASGERFRIDTHCQSACTMFLAIRNVCIVPSATLLFHAGGNPSAGRINAGATQRMLVTYNPALRRYVTENHFMDTLTFHAISGREIISRFGYPACR